MHQIIYGSLLPLFLMMADWVIEPQLHVYWLLLIFSLDIDIQLEEPAKRLTCLPREWGWQCPFSSSDYNSAGKAAVAFGTFWFLICSAVLHAEMKNIWSTHTLCLDWLHKCMILCNPDLWSYFSFFWSISYFAFNHTGQMAGWLPGAVSQIVSLAAWPIGKGQPATTSLFCKNALCLFLLPCLWSQAALAQAKRPAAEAGEVLPEA